MREEKGVWRKRVGLQQELFDRHRVENKQRIELST